MIKVKVNGTDEKVVLEGTVGMTVGIHEVDDYDMDGYWMCSHKEAIYLVLDCNYLRRVLLYNYENGDVEVDCPDNVFDEWVENVRKPYLIKEALDKHHVECEKVAKGKKIKVVRGRKVPIGATGVVFWMGEVNYDPYKRFYNSTMRVGFKGDDGETYWTDARNVEVVNPSDYYEDEKVVEMINAQIEKGELIW